MISSTVCLYIYITIENNIVSKHTYVVLVHSTFSNRVGLPLHIIPYPGRNIYN